MSINDTLNVDLVFNASRTANLDIGSNQRPRDYSRSPTTLVQSCVTLRPLLVGQWMPLALWVATLYDGKRKVMNNQEATGSETVTAAYSGSEVLVGVDAQYSNPINDTLNFIGGVNASLSNEKIGAYSESKYYSWDARTMSTGLWWYHSRS